MDDECAVIKSQQQVIATPTGLTHHLVKQQGLQIGREWPAQATAAQHDAGDPLALDRRRDPAPSDLDFWQFRHEDRRGARGLDGSKRRVGGVA